MYNYYYAKTIWNVQVAIFDLFNDMIVYRFDKQGNIVKTINVPLTFGPVEKTQMAREVDHPSNKTRYYLQVPRMALVPNGITHDPERSYSSNDERFWVDEQLDLDGGNSMYTDFQPTPYNFYYTLFIRSDSLEDLSQILENILPYFNPKLMLRVKEFSFLNIERNLPVRLDGVNFDFVNQMDTETMREVNASLDLVVEGWMYKPLTQTSIVKIINSKYFVGTNAGYDTSGSPITSTSLHIKDVGYKVEGYYETSAMPVSGYDTSGYNADSNTYWEQYEI
jgi:hypothetical protein